jgi:hypothetical protein
MLACTGSFFGSMFSPSTLSDYSSPNDSASSLELHGGSWVGWWRWLTHWTRLSPYLWVHDGSVVSIGGIACNMHLSVLQQDLLGGLGLLEVDSALWQHHWWCGLGKHPNRRAIEDVTSVTIVIRNVEMYWCYTYSQVLHRSIMITTISVTIKFS